MKGIDTIPFTCDLTIEQNEQLKTVAEYNERSMRGQIRHMIRLEYEQMKRDLK